jgi:Ser/Thr protein kinase RdoA (MazF antagonist)
MRQLAQTALDSYGMPGARLKFVRLAGNTLFRVFELRPTLISRPDLYAAGQYMLRIHQPGYQTREAIELELTWLAAMCREAGLPVPQPVPTLTGSLLAQVQTPGIPEERNCSMLRWVKGHRVKTEHVRPEHFEAQGELMARLHQFASGWLPPSDITKRKYDWDGLFREDSGTGIPASEAWDLLPREYVPLYEHISKKMQQVMDRWGKNPQVYGLIHADLGMDANLLFQGGKARAIDFDDSGFGYYAYDLSLALEHVQEHESLPRYREALLEGYSRIRFLDEGQVNNLDLFLAAFCVYLSLWAAASIPSYPKYKAELLQRMKRAFKMANRLIMAY